jgi:putative salt-induced outer membrane protein
MGRAGKWVAVAVAAVLATPPSAGRADEVQFANGDRLTGTVVSAEGGKLKFKSAVAGTVEVDLSAVKTLATDKPVTLRLTDGTVVSKPLVAATRPGAVAVAPAGADAAAAARLPDVPLTAVRSINAKESWTGSLVAGALVTRGNSDTDAFNFAGDATRRTDVDRLNVNGQYLFARQRDADTGAKTTATDNWRAGAKYDYFFAKHFYAFASETVERDRIAELSLRLTPAAGVGYQWIERPGFNFSTEAGVAFIHEEFDNDGTNDAVSLKLAYHLDKQVREGLKVFHNLTYYPSVQELSDYYVLADAGLRADLTERFFTEFKVELKYDVTPAPGASRNDLRYILGVGWSF